MDEMSKYNSYREYKQVLDNELQKTAEGFVRIGFLLKQARDTDILEESGYQNYIEFAKAEYGIDKTTVSRFIRINDKFAENGNSEQLQEQYRGFGYAKLAIMLQLPEEINEELSPSFSKSEIQAVKEEYDAEQSVSDIERMTEEVPEQMAAVDDILGKVIIALGEAETELYLAVHRQASMDHRIDTEKLKDDMIPNNEAIYSIRVPGEGRYMLSLKDVGENTMTNIRTGEKKTYTWEEIAVAWTIIIDMDKDPKADWSEQYGKSFPEEEKIEVAPVQQKKQEAKKQSKVTKAKEVTAVEDEERVENEKEDGRSEEQDDPETGTRDCTVSDEAVSEGDADKSEDHEKETTEDSQEVEKSSVDDRPDDQIPGQDTVEAHPEWIAETESGDVVRSRASSLIKRADMLAAELFNTFNGQEITLGAIELQNSKNNIDQLAAVVENLIELNKEDSDV